MNNIIKVIIVVLFVFFPKWMYSNDSQFPATMITGTLPVMYISCSDEEIMSKDLHDKDYRLASFYLDGMGKFASLGSEEEQLGLQIKARGNFTRHSFSKKPFKIKLSSKQNLLGISPKKSKHYALLALADDGTGFMKNFVGFNLGRRIDEFLPWTPNMQPLELVINGEYRGLYFLVESVRVEEGRIEVAKLNDLETDYTKISGGYLIELDNYKREQQIRLWDNNDWDYLKVSPHTPEQWSPLQRQFLLDQFSAMTDLVHEHSDELWRYLDLDAVAAYYIVLEIIDQMEGFQGSTFLSRDFGEGKKWVFSPIWDCGNAFNRGETAGYFTETGRFNNKWIKDLQQMPTFMNKVRDIWKWFWGTQVDTFFDDLYNYKESIKEAAVQDYIRWGDYPLPEKYIDEYTGDPNYPCSVANNSNMEDRYSKVVYRLQTKINWLTKEWGIPDQFASVPRKDKSEAMPLTDYSDFTDIVSVERDGSLVYYDLVGHKLSAPPVNGIYIVVSLDSYGNKISEKKIVR